MRSMMTLHVRLFHFYEYLKFSHRNDITKILDLLSERIH